MTALVETSTWQAKYAKAHSRSSLLEQAFSSRRRLQPVASITETIYECSSAHDIPTGLSRFPLADIDFNRETCFPKILSKACVSSDQLTSGLLGVTPIRYIHSLYPFIVPIHYVALRAA